MNIRVIAIMIVCLVITLANAQASAPAPAPAKPSAPSTKPAVPTIDDLNRRIQILDAQIRSLQGRVQYKGASLSCDSKNYVEFQLESSTLVFLASCTNIEPYLEGHRITIEVNNPYAVRFSNVSGTLGYGKTPLEVFDRTVDISTTQSFAPGMWTTIVVTVNPSKPEDLRYIELNLKVQKAGGR